MSDTPRMTGSRPAPVRVIRITWASAFLVVGIVVGYLVLRAGFVAAHRILGWTAASIAVALFVEPVIEYLDRFVPRAVAVIATFLVLAGAAGSLVFGVIHDLDTEVNRLRRDAPRAIEDLEARDDEVGRFATDLNLSERAETFLDALHDRFSGEGALAENATLVPVFFVGMILTIFILVYGPGIAIGAARQLGDDKRQVVSLVLSRAAQRARRAVGALLLQGAVIGLLAAGVAVLLDLPAPVVLGLIAGVGGMIPDVGILLGSLPTIALAAAFGSARTAVLLLVAAFVIQAAEALYIRARLNRFGVHVGPSVVWIVALVGYTVYGPGMAFYGVAYVIFGLAVIDEIPQVRGADDPGDTVEPAST